MIGNDRKWLGIGEAAARLGRSVPTLRRWDRDGRLVAERDPVNGRRRYAVRALELLASETAEDPVARRSAARIHGRDREIDAIAELLRTRAAPCVTITGPMGIGKTRLLEEVRRRLGTGALRAPKVTVVDGPGPVPAAVLAGRASGAIVVAAATVPVGIAGEREVPLGPLALPDPRPDPASLRLGAAIELLADAARLDLAALPGEALTGLGRLARASDGHPMVLEHLAAWLWLLSPVELAERVAEGAVSLVPKALELRCRGAFGALGRPDRDVLRGLAETRSPFDLALARAVARPARHGELPVILAKLARQGWLLREAPDAGAPRFRILGPISEICLRDRATRPARARLTAWLAETARPLLEPSAPRTVIARVLAYRDELVAAWADAHARRDPAELALAVGLAAVCSAGDPSAPEHARRIEASLRAHPRAAEAARLGVALGDALWYGGDAPAAARAYAEGEARAKDAGAASVQSLAAIRRATLGPEIGRLTEAERHLARGASLAARSGDARLIALAEAIRAFLLRARADVRGALAAYEKERELALRAGDAWLTGMADASLGECHHALGEQHLARVAYDRARRTLMRVDPMWARITEGYAGLVAWETGTAWEAVPKLRSALRGELSPRFRALFAAALAGVFAELGEPGNAAGWLAVAEETAPDGAPVRSASLLVALAGATDEPSRRSVRASIGRALRDLRDAVSEDERPFARALARAERPDRSTTGSALRVDPELVARRPRLARLLEVLVARSARGEPADAITLFGAAWPSERRVTRAAAEARVRKSISLLRTFGLRGAVVTRDGGYVLARPVSLGDRTGLQGR